MKPRKPMSKREMEIIINNLSGAIDRHENHNEKRKIKIKKKDFKELSVDEKLLFLFNTLKD